MNTILFKLSEVWQSISLKSLSDYVDDKWYNSFRWKAQRRSLHLDNDQKKKVAEWLDGRIRALIKIKLLLDKEIQW